MSKTKAKILVVDDEEDILELVEYNLKRDGYDVIRAEDGNQCLAKVDRYMPDLVLLDLMLPGIDGLDVCKTLKSDSKTEHIPVIMLTAKSEESDVVTGLEVGADDYICKPFSPRMLNARIKAMLRRVPEAGNSSNQGVISRKGLVINPGRREVLVAGKPITLTFSEFEILALMAKKPGWVFSRGQIVKLVKGDGYPVTERAIDVQIVSIRKKLGSLGENIETVRGVGYKYQEH